MSHTPGPWTMHAYGCSGQRFTVQSGGRDLSCWSAPDVRDWWKKFPGGGWTLAEDDARLIAASPLLLAELRAVEAVLSAPTSEWPRLVLTRLPLIRAAIARATQP